MFMFSIMKCSKFISKCLRRFTASKILVHMENCLSKFYFSVKFDASSVPFNLCIRSCCCVSKSPFFMPTSCSRLVEGSENFTHIPWLFVIHKMERVLRRTWCATSVPFPWVHCHIFWHTNPAIKHQFRNFSHISVHDRSLYEKIFNFRSSIPTRHEHGGSVRSVGNPICNFLLSNNFQWVSCGRRRRQVKLGSSNSWWQSREGYVTFCFLKTFHKIVYLNGNFLLLFAVDINYSATIPSHSWLIHF